MYININRFKTPVIRCIEINVYQSINQSINIKKNQVKYPSDHILLLMLSILAYFKSIFNYVILCQLVNGKALNKQAILYFKSSSIFKSTSSRL